MARPVGFSQEAADQILFRISNGEMLTKICEEDGMPTRMQFHGWMTKRPELANDYARAREAWSDFYAEKVVTLSFEPSGTIDETGRTVLDSALIALLKVQTDNIKWLVGKYHPRRYGERPEIPALPGVQVTKIIREIVGSSAEPKPEPPRQLTYQPPEPGELTREQWATLRQLLETIQRAVGEQEPDAVFAVIREALLSHFGADG